MTIDQDLYYINWSPIKVNDWVNGALSIIKSIVGWLGLVILLPIVAVFLLASFILLKFLTKKLVKELAAEEAKLRALIENSDSEHFKDNFRIVMEFQVNLSKRIHEYRERKKLRLAMPILIMSPFFKQEDIIYNSLNQANDSLKRVLYPNNSKTFSQEELASITHRSEGVPDLDDHELDLLMETY